MRWTIEPPDEGIEYRFRYCVPNPLKGAGGVRLHVERVPCRARGDWAEARRRCRIERSLQGTRANPVDYPEGHYLDLDSLPSVPKHSR